MRLFICALGFVLTSCVQKSKSSPEHLRLNKDRITRIVNNSDSIQEEAIHGQEFKWMRTYFRKDTPVATRILWDSLQNVRAIILMKDGHYLQSEQYFENGQLKGNLTYSRPGVLDGPAIYYYKNGRIRTKGSFTNNLRSGKWLNFNKKGELVTVDIYNEKGLIIEHIVED